MVAMQLQKCMLTLIEASSNYTSYLFAPKYNTTYLFIYLALPTRTGTPQQHMPITFA
jgi:hypothetical protein